MFQSSEVRWFHREPMTLIESWFNSKNLVLEKAISRTDFYQILKADDLGIKLREGQVESKKRIREIGLHRFAPDISGFLEEWHKWSFKIDLSDQESGNILNQESNGWVGVKKERIGLKAVESDGWEYLSMDEFPPNGIQIEYTRISILEQVFYSFCLESFGENMPDLSLYPLADIIRGSVLRKENSYSIPTYSGTYCKTASQSFQTGSYP